MDTGLPKQKRALAKAQKDLRLRSAITQKNRKEKAKAKLDKMVDHYLNPYAGHDSKEEEGTELEVVKKEPEKDQWKRRRE